MLLNGDGSLHNWNLSAYSGHPLDGFPLVALPEEFGAVRTTGDLSLNGNQISSLPESFSNVTVGGRLYLKSWDGEEMGPALATARQMSFPNVKEVWK